MTDADNSPDSEGRLSAPASRLTLQALQQLHQAAREQFSQDLPLLLSSDRGRWVIYHGPQRLSINYSQFEAEKSLTVSTIPQEEMRTFWIMTGEDEVEEQLDAAA
jgi:hypothetical protein